MDVKSSETIIELIRREFGEDSELVLSLYKAYRERGVKGIREELNTMLSKYGIKL
ncbi:hypothetical protein [Caldivirga maquilingensis]|uniref:Uncharacterized protein n=1 Tax=Caldivirga maquilingensis (strain ATCC 700844 / DSM 13496 / JCM 10307 / IC-167) TaxID=397948 RepID=A8MBG5_CALMQ|nr:hypothetical protein [Caldivirga maquilingensis]ABW02698.1 hypothetical protein Cmaq_1881 [Caldivirga maquilingensis IC-167]